MWPVGTPESYTRRLKCEPDSGLDLTLFTLKSTDRPDSNRLACVAIPPPSADLIVPVFPGVIAWRVRFELTVDLAPILHGWPLRLQSILVGHGLARLPHHHTLKPAACLAALPCGLSAHRNISSGFDAATTNKRPKRQA